MKLCLYYFYKYDIFNKLIDLGLLKILAKLNMKMYGLLRFIFLSISF